MADDSRPSFADLYKHVIPKYAVHWEELGDKLGLYAHHIAIISKNHAHNPDRTTDCCKEMLKKWLEFDCNATWGKIKYAIKSINVEEASKSQSSTSKLL